MYESDVLVLKYVQNFIVSAPMHICAGTVSLPRKNPVGNLGPL